MYWLTDFRARFLALVGAVITILSLGIGTFFQQSIKYSVIYPDSGLAQMPIARYMNGTGEVTNVDFVSTTNGVDAALANVPYLAIMNPVKTTFTIPATCGTGNCSWDEYDTLAVCNTCADLSDQLKETKHKVTFEGLSGGYETNHWTLPNGFGLTGMNEGKPIDRTQGQPANAMMNITTTLSPIYNLSLGGGSSNWDSVAFTNNGSQLFSVFGVGAMPGTVPEQTDANLTEGAMKGKGFAKPIAYECMLQFCVRRMRAEFVNGSLHESVQLTWTNESQPRPSNMEGITLRPPGWGSGDEPFSISGLAMESMPFWLSKYLIGTAFNQNGASDEWSAATGVGYSSLIMSRFFQNMNQSEAGFPDTMDNIANSLSQSLRNISYQPAPVHGQSFTATSHAEVTWEWLIFPLVELVAGLVLLIMTMVQTRKAGLLPWTNNVLPYFFHGLDQRPAGQHFGESATDMGEEAEELMVEFRREHGGALFIHAKEDEQAQDK